MVRKAVVPTSAGIKAKAERSYSRFLPREMLNRMGIGSKPGYQYVYGITPGGKVVYWGPMPLDQADAAAAGLISGEVFELDTKVLGKATSAIKAELLRRGEDPDKTLSRGHHTGLQDFLANIKGKKNKAQIIERHYPV